MPIIKKWLLGFLILEVMGTEDVNNVYWVPLVGLNVVFIATIVASIWLVYTLWHKGEVN